MVEELKLAIKVDDDAIEQSLLKQFANAEKMANKVVLTFNNIDLDDKAIEAKFKEMQKMAGKNPIDLSIDKSSIEMLSAISKQLGNIFDIAKGKSIIDSSATVADVNKITNAINGLNSSLSKSNTSALQKEEKQIQKNIDSIKKLLDLKYEVKNVNKSFYSGKGNVDWIGIYKSQEEAISSDLSDNKEKLHSSLNLILSEDKNALSSLEEEANKLKTALQPVQEMSNRISSNSSLSDLDKNKGSEEWYKGYAEAYKAIDDRLGELNNQYELTNKELEEYITLQVKSEKIMDRMISHSGGVKVSGAKDKTELKSWIKKSFATDLGLNPEDMYRGLFGNITDALYDGNGISLFDSEGAKRSLREISAEILDYKSTVSGFSDYWGATEDAEKLREINSILNYIKNNASEIESTDFSSQIKKASELVDYYSRRLSEGENTDFYSKLLKDAQDDLQNLISLQERLNATKDKQTNEIITEQQSSSVVEQQNKIQEELKETQKQAEQTGEALSNVVDGNKSNISSGNSIRSVLPSDSEFKNVIANLDLTKSKLGEIVKITRQAHADKDGKFYESFTLTDRNGSTETYGESSKTSKGQLLNYKYVEQNAKAAEQEAKALNQAWEEANKVNNALNETKNTLSSLPRMTELDTQFTSLDAKLSNLNSELTSGKISVADYKKEVKSLTSEYSKLVTIQQNRDVETYKQNAKAAEQETKAVQKAWDKNVKAIHDYMDAVTKLNNLNAKDKGTGKYASQIALQEKNVEELKEKALEARTAITSMINPHDVPLNTWRDYLDVMEKFDQASLGSAESVAKLEDALRKMNFSSLESAGTKFESQFKNLSIKPDGDHQFLSWTNDLKELNAKIDEYNSKVKYLKENNIVDGEQVDEVKELRDEIEQTINVMTKTPQSKRGWTDIGASRAAEKVANALKQNTKMSKEARDAIRAYYNELKSGNPSQPIDEILVKVNQLVQKERELGRVGKSFGEIFKEKVIYGGAAQLAGMIGFYDVINIGRETFETIKEYDNALTEMNKVSKESIETLKDFQKESFGLSDAIGTTASQIQNSTADFLRLGESFEQAKQSAQDANALFKVAEFGNIDEATEALVAMSQAYKELDKSQINDVLNYTGNNFSISTSELASALQRSASTLKVAGNDIYEATALVTAGNAVLQDAETVGSGLKMISLRLLGTEEAKNELASLGEDVDDFVVQTQSKIDETVRSYTAVASNAFKGISVLDENGNYRSTYEILRDISLVYQEILEADKKAGTNRGQALLEVLAGKNRSNVAASILQSPELLTSVYEEAMNNSQGSVAKELESQLQSIETHLNQLKNSWDKLWVNENNREVINFFLDLAKGILEVVDDIGVLNTAFIGIGAGLGIKNIGKTYECMDFKIIC